MAWSWVRVLNHSIVGAVNLSSVIRTHRLSQYSPSNAVRVPNRNSYFVDSVPVYGCIELKGRVVEDL